jgi:predicted MFS family arabinose efflux permease
LLLFTVGIITALVADNIALLLVGRYMQGIKGEGLVALTYVVITDIVTLQEQDKYMFIISL